ncbi:MAG TPA: pyridoxal-phosphate dependent enzyme, partial [Actinophytocola sp.]|nr:pyridoxal-phosphate dependent enzyme [Actinophytocola sp.]
ATAPDLRAAADQIAGRVLRTPLLSVPSLPGILLKAEHRQRGGSFKARGAANAILSAGGVRAIVAGSSGNHGLAVATLGRRLGAAVTVVMARGADAAKAAALTRLGARVLRADGGVAERDRLAREHAERTGALLVPSADHELVVAGAGTVGLELFADAPDAGTVFVPTGGGGLLAGVCLAAETLSWQVRVVGVEPAAGRRYARSLAAGRPVRIPPPATIADGLRGQCPGEVPFPIIRRRVDAMVGVTDEAVRHALDLLRRNGIDAEPSGAVALAGALDHGFRGRAVVIVSGGNTPAALDHHPAPADPALDHPALDEPRKETS